MNTAYGAEEAKRILPRGLQDLFIIKFANGGELLKLLQWIFDLCFLYSGAGACSVFFLRLFILTAYVYFGSRFDELAGHYYLLLEL